MSMDVSSVQVTAAVRREVTERTFERVPVGVAGQPKAKAQRPEVDVRLVCPPEIVRALRREQIIPQVQVPPGAPSGARVLPRRRRDRQVRRPPAAGIRLRALVGG